MGLSLKAIDTAGSLTAPRDVRVLTPGTWETCPSVAKRLGSGGEVKDLETGTHPCVIRGARCHPHKPLKVGKLSRLSPEGEGTRQGGPALASQVEKGPQAKACGRPLDWGKKHPRKQLFPDSSGEDGRFQRHRETRFIKRETTPQTVQASTLVWGHRSQQRETNTVACEMHRRDFGLTQKLPVIGQRRRRSWPAEGREKPPRVTSHLTGER